MPSSSSQVAAAQHEPINFDLQLVVLNESLNDALSQKNSDLERIDVLRTFSAVSKDLRPHCQGQLFHEVLLLPSSVLESNLPVRTCFVPDVSSQPSTAGKPIPKRHNLGSIENFIKLITTAPHIADHVRKLTYLVPDSHELGESEASLLRSMTSVESMTIIGSRKIGKDVGFAEFLMDKDSPRTQAVLEVIKQGGVKHLTLAGLDIPFNALSDALVAVPNLTLDDSKLDFTGCDAFHPPASLLALTFTENFATRWKELPYDIKPGTTGAAMLCHSVKTLTVPSDCLSSSMLAIDISKPLLAATECLEELTVSSISTSIWHLPDPNAQVERPEKYSWLPHLSRGSQTTLRSLTCKLATITPKPVNGQIPVRLRDPYHCLFSSSGMLANLESLEKLRIEVDIHVDPLYKDARLDGDSFESQWSIFDSEVAPLVSKGSLKLVELMVRIGAGRVDFADKIKAQLDERVFQDRRAFPTLRRLEAERDGEFTFDVDVSIPN